MKYYNIISKEVNDKNDLSSEMGRGTKIGPAVIGNENLFIKKFMKADFIPLKDIKRIFQRVKAVDAGCCPPITIEEQYAVIVYGDETEYEIRFGENRHGDVDVKRMIDIIGKMDGVEVSCKKDGKRN